MKQVFKVIGKITFYIFIAAVFGWTASLTLQEVKAILPKDPVTPYFALALFDGGAVVWLQAFIGHARGTFQRAVTLIMLVLDLAGVVILAGGRILTGGQELATVSNDIGALMVYSLIGATIINLVALYVFHIADPETLQAIEFQTLEDTLQEEAVSQARANIESQAQALAAVMAARATGRLKYQLRLPMNDQEAAEVVSGQQLNRPAPLVIPAKKKPTGIPAWLFNLRRKLSKRREHVTTYEQSVPAPIQSSTPDYYPPYGDRQHPDVVFARLPSDELASINAAWMEYDQARWKLINKEPAVREEEEPRAESPAPFQAGENS